MEDLQSLLEKINREGVEKAEASAKEIIGQARNQADELLKNAKAEAEKIKAEAEKAAEDFRRRATETLREASRDLILATQAAITAKLESLLVKDVKSALADDDAIKPLILDAIRELTGPGEITLGPRLADALRDQLSQTGNFTVVTDPKLETGFTVKLDQGRVEHSYTAETIADELARHLRSDLANLLK